MSLGRIVVRVLLLTGCLPLAVQVGCDAADAPVVETTSEPREDRYRVRGRVLAAEGSVKGLVRLSIAHEALPDFRDLETGEVVGMPAMTMPFPLAEGLEAPALGEEIEFSLRVDGGDHGGLPYIIERIEAVSR